MHNQSNITKIIFFDLGFTAFSRIFHLYRADHSSNKMKGDNSKSKIARVVILVRDTSSCSTSLPSIIKIYAQRYSTNIADTKSMHNQSNITEGDFFFDLGFTALSRIFHLYHADRSSKVGENHLTIRKQNLAFSHVT